MIMKRTSSQSDSPGSEPDAYESKPETICRSRTLTDEPARQDELGPHLEIAKAVSSLIEEEPGGKAVALIGSWGSGKSTVVNLLNKELGASDSTDALVFVFDAWVHEGDPLRLAFLRTFAKQLRDRWGGPDFTDRLDRLEKRTEETFSQAATTIDRTSAFVLLALSILPLGYLLVAEGIGRRRPEQWWGMWLGVLLVLPFAYITGRALYRVLRKKPTNLPALLARQLPESITVSTVRTPDPTTLEFQRTFSEMISSALLEDTRRRRLVIVADNLDRVDRESALKAWGTMRSFFDFGPSDIDDTGWTKQLWLVVPFDPGGLSRLWGNDPGEHTGNSSEGAQVTTNDPLVDVFLEKTFQVTFHVPSPVLSDWREFLVSCLEKALPDHESDEYHLVYRVVHRRVALNGHVPTPRSLKRFVNRLSAIHRQWCRQGVSLVNQARYALVGEQVAITAQGVLVVSGEEFRDEETAREMAAIHFNVPPSKAFQVLLSPRIERALQDGASDEVERLAETPGFFEACEHLLDEGEPRSAVDIGNAGRALRVIPPGANPYARRIWHQLEKLTDFVESVAGLDEEVAQGFVSIVENVPDQIRALRLGESIISKCTSRIRDFSSGEDGSEPEEINSFALGFVRLLSELRASLGQDSFTLPSGLEADDAVLARVLAAAAASEPDRSIYASLIPSDGQDINAFSASLTSGEFDSAASSAFVLGVELKPEREYEAFLSAVEESLKPGSLTEDVARPIIRAFAGFALNISDPKSLNRPALRGAFLHHYQEATGRSDWTTAALCVIPVLLTDPKVQAFEPILGHSNNGANQLRQVSENPGQHVEFVVALAATARSLGILTAMLNTTLGSQPSSQLGVSLLARTLEDQGLEHQLPAQILFEHYESISAHISDDQMNQLMQGMQQEGAIEGWLHNSGFSIADARLYEQLVDIEGWDSLCNPLRDALRNVSDADWQRDLESERRLLRLAIKMASSGCEVSLVAPFRTAVLALAQKALIDPAISIPTSADLSRVMAPQSFHALLRSVVDLLSTADVGDASSVLTSLGGELIQSGVVDQRIGPLIARYGPAAIGRSIPDEVAWILELMGQHKGNVGPEAAGALRGSIHAKLSDGSLSGDERDKLDRILSQLGERK